MTIKPQISLFYPVYNDEKTIESLTLKAIKLLGEVSSSYEILIINDGSSDKSLEIANRLQTEHPNVRCIDHGKNLGYGSALITGFNEAQYDWICQTDGDDEYEIYDLYKLLKQREFYPLIITFRYTRLYSGTRVVISRIYNYILSFLFKTNYRDISAGLRLVNKKVIEDVDLISSSPFIGAELTIKAMLKGYPVGEVGIQTFPRTFGKSNSTTYKNILATISDMFLVKKEVFSSNYDMPYNRRRNITE